MGKDRTPEEVAARKAKKDRKRAARREELQAQQQVAEAAAKEARRLLLQNTDNSLATLSNRLNPARSCFDPQLHAAWQKMSKPEKKKMAEEDAARREAAKPSPIEPPESFPFPTSSSDHCETSPKAYGHVAPLLKLLAKRLSKSEEELQIYDPYYCSGAVKRHLGALGFPSVYNECEDFYDCIAQGRVPEHDVVVTNPPYSEDPDGGPNHVERLLRFCVEGGKPFLINMPEYAASAAYYAPCFQEEPPLFLAPHLRYHFWTLPQLRKGVNKKAHHNPELGIRCSPFVALWYVSLQPALSHAALLKRAARGRLQGMEATPEGEAEAPEAPEVPAVCRLCRTLDQLPDSRHLFTNKPLVEVKKKKVRRKKNPPPEKTKKESRSVEEKSKKTEKGPVTEKKSKKQKVLKGKKRKAGVDTAAAKVPRKIKKSGAATAPSAAV